MAIEISEIPTVMMLVICQRLGEKIYQVLPTRNPSDFDVSFLQVISQEVHPVLNRPHPAVVFKAL
jgi:hypothetical protein